VLVNTQISAILLVGLFNSSEFKQIATIYFPGNLTVLPIVTKSTLEVSFNSGLENHSIGHTSAAAAFYTGQRLAVMQVNQRTDLLPEHTLVSNDVAFGAAKWEAAWAIPRILANRGKLGLAYIAGYGSDVTMNTLVAFEQLGLSL